LRAGVAQEEKRHMQAARARRIWLLVALAARLGFAQAPLPTSWAGPWQSGTPPEGWTFFSLGGPDYNPDYDGLTNGAAKLDGTGDYVSIDYIGAAGAVFYWVKGLTVSGGVFRVEQSIDGLDWTPLQTYTTLPTNAEFKTHFPALAARHLRFIYAERVTGNIGLDGISIAAFVQPVIETVNKTGGVTRVSLGQSVLGRTYALQHTLAITNVPVAWTLSDSQSGTGGALLLRDLTPTNAARTYRVRDVTP
jgi:hypothetical protein